MTLRNIDLGVGTLESYFFAGKRDWIKMVLGFFHLVLCTDESLSWARLFLHVFFVLILLQQRRHNQRRCKWSCHQWLTTSTKTYDLWLKLRCCLLGLLFFRVHCTLITKTKICLLSLGGGIQCICWTSLGSPGTLRVELEQRVVASSLKMDTFGIWHPEERNKNAKRKWILKEFYLENGKTQNPIWIINDKVSNIVSRSIECSAGCGRMRLNMLMTLLISSRCSW